VQKDILKSKNQKDDISTYLANVAGAGIGIAKIVL